MNNLISLLLICSGQNPAETPLAKALTFHAPFDNGFGADFSTGSKECWFKLGKDPLPATVNADVAIARGEGKFGGALAFPKKGNSRPHYRGQGVLGYNDKNWSATVSVWLRLDPDRDLQPGYCDPVQIVGNDTKKGYVFLEWSKDETPRYFRYAIRPLFPIWNPDNLQWADIPFHKRPMVQVAKAPFSRDRWTHVVFTLENINDKPKKPSGRLYIDGKPQGAIENWDLTFAWDPASVAMVLGAAYVGKMDDLAVFNRALSDAEVMALQALPGGVADLRGR